MWIKEENGITINESEGKDSIATNLNRLKIINEHEINL